jgi:hypothetical protein
MRSQSRASKQEEQREELQMRRASNREGEFILIQQRRRKAHFSENTEINSQINFNQHFQNNNLPGGK